MHPVTFVRFPSIFFFFFFFPFAFVFVLLVKLAASVWNWFFVGALCCFPTLSLLNKTKRMATGWVWMEDCPPFGSSRPTTTALLVSLPKAPQIKRFCVFFKKKEKKKVFSFFFFKKKSFCSTSLTALWVLVADARWFLPILCNGILLALFGVWTLLIKTMLRIFASASLRWSMRWLLLSLQSLQKAALQFQTLLLHQRN